MRIGELSALSGVPVSTIKYYIREGLLPPGERTAVTRATYAQSHLDRLALVGALRDVGGLPIDTVRRVIVALQSPAARPRDAFRLAFDALADPDTPSQPELSDARREIGDTLRAWGWFVDDAHPALATLAAAWAAARRLWHARWLQPEPGLDALRPYAHAARELAVLELPADRWRPRDDPADTLTAAVLGTVLFEPILLSLRRLAHEDRAHRLLSAPPVSPPESDLGQELATKP